MCICVYMWFSSKFQKIRGLVRWPNACGKTSLKRLPRSVRKAGDDFHGWKAMGFQSWMVYFMENPCEKWTMTGGSPILRISPNLRDVDLSLCFPCFPCFLYRNRVMETGDAKIGIDMGVSINGGTPKSSIFMGFSYIKCPFSGTPIYGTPHMERC